MFQANPHLIPGEQQFLLEIRAAADDFWIQQLQPVDEETRGAFDTEGGKQQGLERWNKFPGGDEKELKTKNPTGRVNPTWSSPLLS